jgi:hypothetical protein
MKALVNSKGQRQVHTEPILVLRMGEKERARLGDSHINGFFCSSEGLESQ